MNPNLNYVRCEGCGALFYGELEEEYVAGSTSCPAPVLCWKCADRYEVGE